MQILYKKMDVMQDWNVYFLWFYHEFEIFSVSPIWTLESLYTKAPYFSNSVALFCFDFLDKYPNEFSHVFHALDIWYKSVKLAKKLVKVKIVC